MIELGIYEGDKVIVKKTNIAKDGDIVIAFIDGGYTLKTYRNVKGKVYLEPANKYPTEQLVIFGVAQGIVRKF